MISGHSLHSCLVRKVRVGIVAIETIDVMCVYVLQDLLELFSRVQMKVSAWTKEVVDVFPWVFYALYSLLNR